MEHPIATIEPHIADSSDQKLLPETLAQFGQVLPALCNLNEQMSILEGCLPSDHQHFAGQQVTIQPYQTDRRGTTAVHKIQIGVATYRLNAFANDNGDTVFSLTLENDQGQLQPASTAQAAAVGDVLAFAVARSSADAPPSPA